jgi:GDPmannose 4,6-dehydratase
VELFVPTALITGITGQDGAYLAQFLLDKGYEVVGLHRASGASDVVGDRLRWLGVADRVRLVEGDLTDLSVLVRTIQETCPDEVYNLAAQSLVATSWAQPLLTGSVTALGAVNVLEAIRIARPQARLYQASSSEMFGNARESPQSEKTPFYPRSPYGAAKAYAHWMTVNYRESFGLHASCGILFNHESPLRGIAFVMRKVSDGVARIKLGLARELPLGNLEVTRDWGHARDYVRAMWLMLQQDVPDDYVVATGRSVSLREMVARAFACAGLDADEFVRVRAELLRPAEIEARRGDASKARARLGWEPTIALDAMLSEMVEADLARHRRQCHQ